MLSTRERTGEEVLWMGTGWTGQPVKWGNNLYVGSLDGHLYSFNSDTGSLHTVHRRRTNLRRMFGRGFFLFRTCAS